LGRPQAGPDPDGGVRRSVGALIGVGVNRPDGAILKAYHSALRLDLSEQCSPTWRRKW